MHKYKYDRLPLSFTNMYTYKSQQGDCRLREEDGNFFIPPLPKTLLSPHIESAKAWNHVPYIIKMESKESLFKNQFKKFLISKYSDDCDKIKCYTCHPTQCIKFPSTAI